MKTAGLLRNFFLILLVAAFSVGVFSSPAQGAVGDPCQTKLDNRDTDLSTGTCSAAGNCSGTTGLGGSCGSGQICCVESVSSTRLGDQACKGKALGADCLLDDDAGKCTVGDQDGEPYVYCSRFAVNNDTGGNIPLPAAGSCSGGTCRPNQCEAGENGTGSCTTGGICCMKPSATGVQASVNFTNPLEFNTVEEVLTKLLSTLQAIIVTLALVFLVIGAILYIISAGDEGRMETGKKAITAAMIGLAIGLAAPSFLKEIGGVLGWGETNSALVDSAPTLTSIALKVLHFLLSIVGILAIIMLVIGGLAYLTAAGDEERVETGKKMVKYAIIGIIIAFGALVIVTQIADFFT